MNEKKTRKDTGPSKYRSDSSSTDSESDSSDSADDESKAKNSIGPAMPAGWRKRSPSPQADHQDDDGYGPVVPSKRQRTEEESGNKSTIGPVLPSNFKPHSDSEDDDDVIGPRLPGVEGETSMTAADEFERRAERMKNKLLGKDEPQVMTRETWMTELPDKLGASLLGMPVAKTRFGDGNKTKIDRAGWTETPQDREKRLKEGKSQFEATEEGDFSYIVSGRDEEMQAAVEQLNSNRQDSLLDLHRKKQSKKQKKKEKKEKKDKKKKKKKEKDKKSKKDKKDKKDQKEKPKERRPFDRDVDLKANVFDNAKKNALIKRSQQLNSRFQSSGQTGQFL